MADMTLVAHTVWESRGWASPAQLPPADVAWSSGQSKEGRNQIEGGLSSDAVRWGRGGVTMGAADEVCAASLGRCAQLDRVLTGWVTRGKGLRLPDRPFPHM